MAGFEPLSTEHFFRQLFGRSSFGMAGALQQDRVWRQHIQRALQHLRRYVETNGVFTDSVHRDRMRMRLDLLEERSRMLPPASPDPAAVTLREQALVTGLIDLCLTLLGDPPNHWDRRRVNRAEHFSLDRHRTVHYSQSVRLSTRASRCCGMPTPASAFSSTDRAASSLVSGSRIFLRIPCHCTPGRPILRYMSDSTDDMESGKCLVCRGSSGAKYYCRRCKALLRSSKRKGSRKARLRALHDQWSEDRQAFVCKYTSTPLTHSGGARDAEWEHAIPGDPESVVLVAAVVNRMKADLTEDQWNDMVRALYATRIEGKPFDEKAFPPNWQPKSTARRRRTRGDDSPVTR